MPLSWNEIRDRALRFSREWDAEAAERAGSQTFWNEFFEVFVLLNQCHTAVICDAGTGKIHLRNAVATSDRLPTSSNG